MPLDFSAASKQYKSLSYDKEQPSLIRVSIKMLHVMDPCVLRLFRPVPLLSSEFFNKNNKEIILEERTTSILASFWVQEMPKLQSTASLS